MDWIAFLSSRGIEYRQSGTSNVDVHCPLCGQDDQSFHLSISLDGHGWKCWRRPDQHYGRSSARLIQLLMHCSWEQATALAGQPNTLPDNLIAKTAAVFGSAERKAAPRRLDMPKDFKPFGKVPSFKPFYKYLHWYRHFTPTEIETAGELYDLRYCTRGPFRWRIIFPVKFHRQLVSWTGRGISNIQWPRYKALTDDSEKAAALGVGRAVGPITDYLLFFDELRASDARVIYLTEGPFDALRLMLFGRSMGIVSTCFFGASPTQTQIDLLHELLPRFKKRYLLLDRNTTATSMHVQSQLLSLGVQATYLPSGVKDPGDLTRTQFMQMSKPRLSA